MQEISEISDFQDISRGCDRFYVEGMSPAPLKTDYLVFEPPSILLGCSLVPGKLTSQAAEVHLQMPFLISHFL